MKKRILKPEHSMRIVWLILANSTIVSFLFKTIVQIKGNEKHVRALWPQETGQMMLDWIKDGNARTV